MWWRVAVAFAAMALTSMWPSGGGGDDGYGGGGGGAF
jgi:hypothetical protein